MSGSEIHASWSLEDCLRYAQSNLGVGYEGMSKREIRQRWEARGALSAALKRAAEMEDELARLRVCAAAVSGAAEQTE